MQIYGVLNGSEFDGYLGAVQRREVDTFAADITPSAQRLRYFEFSIPWIMGEYIIVSGKTMHDTFAQRIALMFRTFNRATRIDCTNQNVFRMCVARID